MRDFLPIGSVVLLKETNKKLMIIGRVQICEGKAYKYSAVTYPEGYGGSDTIYLFNEQDIEQVYFEGMKDEEENEFKKILIEVVDKNINRKSKEKE